MTHMAEKIITALELDAAGVTNPPTEESRDAWETRHALRALLATETLTKLAEIYHASRTGDERAQTALDAIGGIIRNTHANLKDLEG